ncbi:MAG: chromosomal replication initiator protein DnaA, partial [Duodenibacillus sp.]|nr:chromosomal replication initiator protein DnaA [Duodenibacillus sp.]
MQDFWSRCLRDIQSSPSISKEIFATWFSDISADCSLVEEGSLTLMTSSWQKQRSIDRNYGELIAAAAEAAAGRPLEIRWEVAAGQPAPEAAAWTASAEPAGNAEEDLGEAAGLQPLLTFENLVQGKANQLAYSAAMQIAECEPGCGRGVYNPLYIFGGVGLGKTHLMHAIGHRYLQRHPKARVLCISAQQYLEDFTNAMRLRQVNPEAFYQVMQQFGDRYRKLDLLLIDDVQSFAGRAGTQANFFEAFESLVPHGKQIVMTSDTYPRSLKDFHERLLSRITQGLVVEVEPPELEMRVQILLQKAGQSGVAMPDDVAEFIAKHLRSHVRELEGAVNQIRAYTNFHGIPVSVDSARLALRDTLRLSAVPVTLESIQKQTAAHYGLRVADLCSKTRAAPVAKARQVAMFLAKELTENSLAAIGAAFGGRNHATVINAINKIKDSRQKDPELKHDINVLEQRI